MISTTSQRPRASRRTLRLVAPTKPLSAQRRRKGWLVSALARIVQRSDHDEATFYRLEYRGHECPPRYISARDMQHGFELPGVA